MSRIAGRKAKDVDEPVRPIPRVDGYLIGKTGIVYSTLTDPPLEVASKAVAGRKGQRRRIRLSAGKVREYYVAALVLEAWVGPRPESAVAQHYDADPMNCSVDNLFWGYPQTRIDPREFVAIWQSASSVREVAERLGKEYPTVLNIAKRMREHGVDLIPIEQRHQTDEDYADLAKLADQLKNGQE